MEDIQQQLAALRQRSARVDRKYADAAPPRPPLRPAGPQGRTRWRGRAGVLAVHPRDALAKGGELLLEILHSLFLCPI